MSRWFCVNFKGSADPEKRTTDGEVWPFYLGVRKCGGWWGWEGLTVGFERHFWMRHSSIPVIVIQATCSKASKHVRTKAHVIKKSKHFLFLCWYVQLRAWLAGNLAQKSHLGYGRHLWKTGTAHWRQMANRQCCFPKLFPSAKLSINKVQGFGWSREM